jgi:hypothetical protein
MQSAYPTPLIHPRRLATVGTTALLVLGVAALTWSLEVSEEGFGAMQAIDEELSKQLPHWMSDPWRGQVGDGVRAPAGRHCEHTWIETIAGTSSTTTGSGGKRCSGFAPETGEPTAWPARE